MNNTIDIDFESILNYNLINNETKFFLKLDYQKNIPNTIEYIFFNLVQFRDEVYYIKTRDIFNFFYFYRTEDGIWYWSPPKKTDPEDLWIESPNTKIASGYWINKKIPDYIEQFIIWLDIFSPRIPEFYTEKKRENNKKEEDKLKNKEENDKNKQQKDEKIIEYQAPFIETNNQKVINDNKPLVKEKNEELKKKDGCIIF